MIDARSVPMRALLMLLIASALVACAAEHHTPDDAGLTAGTGGVGGEGGASGDSGEGGSAGSGNVGGSAGSSGLGGVGGSGGVAGQCAFPNPVLECDRLVGGWFALKTTLDVWWSGVPTRDPGRGEIEITMLGNVTNMCDGENDGGAASIKICDIDVPPYTSDVACTATQMKFPEESWERPNMPRFATSTSLSALEPGGTFVVDPAVALVGIDLENDHTLDAWPTSSMTGTFPCEAGTGAACFPDHDGDSLAGVTARFANVGDTYVGPYGDGRCTNGTAYRFVGAIVEPVCIACGGGTSETYATSAQLGMRLVVGSGGLISGDCVSGVGAVGGSSFDLRGWSCTADPASLHPSDSRLQTMDYTCASHESQFMDDNLPDYRVLDAGEVPGDSQPPLGWVLEGREFDKSPSVGSRSAFVRLGSQLNPEPSCATVRATVFPE